VKEGALDFVLKDVPTCERGAGVRSALERTTVAGLAGFAKRETTGYNGDEISGTDGEGRARRQGPEGSSVEW